MIGLLVVAQLAIVTHAPDSVAACDAVEVTVAVSGPGSTAPQLIPPSFAPFDVLRSSVTPHVQLDPRNGGSIIAEFRYVLTTDKTGSFTLPPFEARLRDAVTRSKPLRIAVREARAGDGVPTVVARARIDTSLDVNFRALTEPETVYVGQQANYEVAVFLNETVRDKLRRNPTFYPPDMQAMLAYDLPAVAGAPRRKVGTRCFDALVYQRALFPLVPGRFVIAPAQLVYSLPLTSSFFSREESHELVTDSTILVAVEPPAAGRPPEYSGAIGDLAIASRVDSPRGRVGDPMLLTVRLSGAGNVKLFPPPKLNIPWANLVRADERVQVDTAARKIRGSKEFDWVLTPKVAGELDVPPIRYGYFNPETRRYAVASAAPERVTIAPGALAVADTGRSEPLLALRTEYRGPVDRPPTDRAYFWLLLALAPLPSALGRIRRSPRRAVAPSAAAKLRLMARTSIAAHDPCEVRRVYANALAERLGVSVERFTRPGSLARALRRAGVSITVASDAERLLRELDEAAYGRATILRDDTLERATAVVRSTDVEALPRHQLRLPDALLLLLIAVPVLAGALRALSPDTARQEFELGVKAYAAHQFDAARLAFANSAKTAPWAPDAWANLGTSAWSGSDTLNAVVGWQRALRLQPTAADVRERLPLAQSAGVGSIGFVPPVSSIVTLCVAVGAWCMAWLLAAILSFRRSFPGRVSVRRWAYAGAMVGVLLLLGGLELDQRLAARDIGVLRTTTRLSSDPALGGDTKGTALIGEVARAVRREGAWTYVTLDEQREGWIESSILVSLERGTPGD